MNKNATLYIIREVAKEDEPVLQDMLYHAVYIPPGNPLPDKDIVRRPKLAKYVRQWGTPGDEGLLILHNIRQQAAGAVWSRLFSEEQKGFGYVDADTPELSIALLPEYRNQGLGTQLLEQFLAHLQEKGYSAVSLSVSSGNPAIRLYRRVGFHDTGIRCENSLTMLKYLNTLYLKPCACRYQSSICSFINLVRP